MEKASTAIFKSSMHTLSGIVPQLRSAQSVSGKPWQFPKCYLIVSYRGYATNFNENVQESSKKFQTAC